MRTSFYTYFSSGFGTIWGTMIIFGLVTGTNIRLGTVGLIGLAIAGALYAGYRRASDADKIAELAERAKINL